MIIAKYYEYNLDAVMRYFAGGFQVKEGAIAADIPPDWFVDTGRGVVVFKLFIEDGRPVESPDSSLNDNVDSFVRVMCDEGKISIRLRNAILRSLNDTNSKSIDDFVRVVRSEESLITFRNFGKVGQAALIKALGDYGLWPKPSSSR